MKFLLLLLLPCFCLASDKSDQVPTITVASPTNTVNISYHQRSPRRIARIVSPGAKHPQVEMAHELRRRQQEEDDFITCCCFFKMKKPTFR